MKETVHRMSIANLLLFLIFPLCWGADDHFRDVAVFENKTGYLAAFADFNSDKAIDVFVLVDPWQTEPGFRQVDIILAEISRFRDAVFRRQTLYRNPYARISSVVSADFDGDRIEDLLLYSKPNSTITILWGTGQYNNSSNQSLVEENLVIPNVAVEPILFDYDGDRVVDILTAMNNTINRAVITLYERKFIYQKLNLDSHQTFPEIIEHHSNSFVDVTGDLNADIVISTKNHFEIWPWVGNPKNWTSSTSRDYPGKRTADHFGQSVFVDFGSTGQLNHIITDDKKIYIYNATSREWEGILELNGTKKFWKPPSPIDLATGPRMFLKSADLDQDGYPDFMAIVQDNNTRTVTSIFNKKCEGSGNKCIHGRRLEETSPESGIFKNHPNIVNLGFFDIKENGKMDVLITEYDPKNKNWSLNALENMHAEDACFIKVITVSGLCGQNGCTGKNGAINYGYNQPGALAKYSITDLESKLRSSVAAQLYQTGHGALQLPYILFGIGLSPNFVESLEVRMPGLNDSHQWTQIIPNSQMLVIPNPPLEPSLWQTKLFITPSRKMLVTGITLFGVVLVNAIIILVLHLLEKKADRIERQRQAHKFNFDAM